MRVAIYCRVSTDEQVDGYSLDYQERACRDAIKTRTTWQVADVYREEGISGQTAQRRELRRLRTDIAAGHIDLVMVHEPSRLARKMRLMEDLIEEFITHQVGFTDSAFQVDLITPHGWAMFQMRNVFNELYVRELTVRVKDGLAQKLMAGGYNGPVPLGYRRNPDAKLEPSEDAETVRLIYALYGTGNHSDMTIAEELNAHALMTLHKGRRVLFQRDSVKTILTNPIYIGMVRYKGGELQQGKHEALIDRDLWDHCQAIRARRSHQDGGRLPIRGMGGLLSELAYCGKCGARMHTQLCGQGESRQRYYRCSARRRFGTTTCGASFVLASWVEQQVLDMLRALSLPPPLRDAVIGVVQQRMTRPMTVQDHDLARLETQLERLKDMYQMGDLDKATYVQRRTQLQQRIAAAVPAPQRTLDIERAMEVLTSIDALLVAATLPQQRALIQQVLTTIWIEKSTVTAIRPAPNYLLLVDVMARMWVKRPRLDFSQAEPHPPPFPALWQAFQTPFTSEEVQP